MNLEDVIKLNSNLIYKIASKFYGSDIEDLYQAGVVGLIKAYHNYKYDGKTKFSTYAYEYIYGEMYLLVNNKNIKINRDIVKLYHLIEKTRYTLAQKRGRMPSNHELALFLNISEYKINEAMIAGMEVMSIDKEENNFIYDTIGTSSDLDNNLMIKDGLNILNEEEKQIIVDRYFNDMTQCEVAKKLSLTQVKVSRYEKKGLNKMQNYFGV